MATIHLKSMSYHWWHSERSSSPAIAQYVNGVWYVIGEVIKLTDDDLKQRGWEYLGPVTHRPRSDYLDR